MLDQETALRRRIDELEADGRYPQMVAPLEELVSLLRYRCSGGGCSAASETPEYAAALDRLAGLHRNLGNIDRATELYRQAVQTSATVFGTHDPNYATTLNNYAGLLRMRGQYEDAEEIYLRAGDIYEATLGPHHVLTVSALNNRGLVFQDLGRAEEARELHEEALGRLREEGGEIVAEATTLNNLASAWAKLGEYAKARAYMEEASAIYERTVGRNSDLYLGQLHNLASMQALSGDYAGALPRLEWVTTRAREMFGPRSENYHAVLRNLLAVCQHLGKADRVQQIESELEGLDGQGAVR